jgi:hypothetical protein
MIEARAIRIFIRIYSLLKSERLSATIKLKLHQALIRSEITDTCPTWELAADTYTLKLQRRQNNVPSTTGNFPRCTPIRYVYDYITKLCRKKTEVI